MNNYLSLFYYDNMLETSVLYLVDKVVNNLYAFYLLI